MFLLTSQYNEVLKIMVKYYYTKIYGDFLIYVK